MYRHILTFFIINCFTDTTVTCRAGLIGLCDDYVVSSNCIYLLISNEHLGCQNYCCQRQVTYVAFFTSQESLYLGSFTWYLILALIFVT